MGQRGRMVSFLLRAFSLIRRISSTGLVQSGGHKFVHRIGIIPFHKIRRPTAAAEKLLQFLMLNAGQHGRIADFIAIQVKDGQNGSIGDRVEKLVGLPGGCQEDPFLTHRRPRRRRRLGRDYRTPLRKHG